METVLVGPARYIFLFMPTIFFSFLILLVGVSVFTYVISIRLAPLVKSSSDYRFNRWFDRIKIVIKIWLMQYRHPRYMFAGIIHILIFIGFIVLGFRTISLVLIGFSDGFVMPWCGGMLSDIYSVIKNYFATIVLISCIVAIYRRYIIKPDRYAIPDNYEKCHAFEALFVLGIIIVLMLSEAFFEASSIAASAHSDMFLFIVPPFTLVWILKKLLLSISVETLQIVHIISYYVHDVVFFFFLCYLPFGKHFHVITSLFNVFFMRLNNGKIKPVRYGVDNLDTLDSLGVKKVEDFTWKHILDFYSCADCGRCSDNCPAHAVGRPLSPRFISIKARDLIFKNYPVYPYGASFVEGVNLMGNIYTEDEVWSCTTCGACEQECPLGIEYIDKIVDLRRGLVDDGIVPQSLQKPFMAIEKRGNPWGKMEKNRANWLVKLSKIVQVKRLDQGDKSDVLYFVDSITSYDDRMQNIAVASATILNKVGSDFGVLGKMEKDSGNEVVRFGEEMLFQDVKKKNTNAILSSGVNEIIVSDPHTYNVLKNEYDALPPIKHMCQFILENVKLGAIKFKHVSDDVNKVYTYHDPCYLGRHNNVYEDPRLVLDYIDELSYVEMKKNRDRSFCCGGGGLMLFYEPEEDQRMGVLRVKMAADVGANVIVTSCPFCMVNIEDAIKVAGFEGKMSVIDLTELVVQHMA